MDFERIRLLIKKTIANNLDMSEEGIGFAVDKIVIELECEYNAEQRALKFKGKKKNA